MSKYYKALIAYAYFFNGFQIKSVVQKIIQKASKTFT